MKSKIHPAVIGAFIAGAIVILFGSIIVFGSGRFFRKTKDMLLTFQEPVAGLDTGAPVKLLGVPVGTVKDISLAVSKESADGVIIDVVVEIDRKNLQSMFRNYRIDLDDRARFERIVEERGLRGQLDVLSLVSGQLYIALDFFPNRKGFQLHQEDEHDYWEIPTLPSTKRQLVQSVAKSLGNVAEFDFKGTSDELKGLLSQLRTEFEKIKLGEVGSSLAATLDQARTLLADPKLRDAISNLDESLAQIRQLGERLNSGMEPLLSQAETDLKKAEVTIGEATKTMRSLQAQVEPGSTLSRELIRALGEASATLGAWRQLAQELERNPNWIITGRKYNKP